MRNLFTLLSAFGIATSVSAGTLITSEIGYAGPRLDLSAFDNGAYNFTFGPVTVDGFTFTAAPGGGGNSGQGSVVGQGNYGLGVNGSFGGAAVYIGVDSETGFAQLLGTTAFSQIGFFTNYAPDFGDSMTFSSLDAAGSVIETFDIGALAPISTPDGFNQFEFRGIRETSAIIYGLRFGGSFVLVTGTADGVPVPGSVVPEPATWTMLITGFGLAGSAMRRRRSAVVC